MKKKVLLSLGCIAAAAVLAFVGWNIWFFSVTQSRGQAMLAAGVSVAVADAADERYLLLSPEVAALRAQQPTLYVYERVGKKQFWIWSDRYRLTETVTGTIPSAQFGEGVAVAGAYLFTPRDAAGNKQPAKTLVLFGSAGQPPGYFAECVYTLKENGQESTQTAGLHDDPHVYSFVLAIPGIGDADGQTRALVNAQFYDETGEPLCSYEP
jgi:hypothetical protein